MKGMAFLGKLSKTDCANIMKGIACYGLNDFVQYVQLTFSENHSGTHYAFNKPLMISAAFM